MVLRKHPKRLYPLSDFEAKGILTPAECRLLRDAVHARKTIMIAGAVGTGKTSIVNALLHELRDTQERIVVCEEAPELIVEAQDTAFLRTVEATEGRSGVDLRALCRDVLRLSPDRVVVGETRGGECLEMLKIFDTGHPGMSTIHADSAEGTLSRIEQLVLEVSQDPQRPLIASAIDLIVYMQRHGAAWRPGGILAVDGWDGRNYQLRSLT
jgi:type IV secretion system protein VirB11